ncbi:MAG: hypothetical protein A3C43_03595 [Candidatus Schekmanbacteria bacterium RIFCSPHIGHO2_02_FULL_38_11]|uniref:Secretin/TonB short N-terminal domain-containing protein n=1 Tax=Candidatus Schekmanbacteria bacterium RIFCSPLOWO2_12_FULL_38_15 TaxID=1817883 RepID=A0A1F7SLS1_9BACT|nr:MAG: hypothetical protein A2043_08835 [Candidatus Schekmanbacteria bacterium GWA2_38_9]OGL49989.1 MAG: hypothetical protein A3C43_03595 [Candidatus Schekmanbacteria bacterium RIFCSPHIGHO2_02_FULL_38_11]OGL51227.1 MAG: hypothetical protein A3H37_10455 [Candidatus Schekmanbacteria bacterium RIFCSPLOWO2_02_FULL_38_14]OGL54178.1 MAG: hypothetical protein A3G31_05295 [Candidatus Schekmanbacteria bacterium RIFCSPLOWO2_12_FULL_38_15]
MLPSQTRVFISVFFFTALLGCAMKTPKDEMSSFGKISERKLITDMSFEDTPTNTIIRLKSNGVLSYSSYILTNPTRIVIDINDTILIPGIKDELEIDKGLVKKAKLREEKQPAEMTRLEIEMEEIAPRRIEMAGEDLVVDIENPKESESVKEDLEAIKESLRKGVDEKLGEIEAGEESEAGEGAEYAEEEETQEAGDEPQVKEEMKYKGEKISFDFQDASVEDVIRLIAEVSGMNFVIEKGVTGKINVKLNKIPWDQALDLVMKINDPQLVTLVDEGIYRIMTRDKSKKMRMDKAEETKARREEEEDAVAILPLTTKTFRLSYAKAKDIENNVRNFMSSRVKSGDALITIDDRTNSVIVKDVEKNIREMEDVISNLDKPTPQVKIEAKIVEVADKLERALGIQWGGRYIASPVTGNATDREFPNTISLGGAPINPDTKSFLNPSPGNTWLANFPVERAASGIGLLLGNVNNTLNLEVRLSALEAENKVKILNKPELLVVDNEKATIQVGRQLPMVTVDEQGKQSIAWKDVGIILEVTPQITADKSIFMKVKVEKSERGEEVAITTGKHFSIDTTKSETMVMIRNGDTTVIGGLYFTSKTNSNQGTPFLSKVPILGNLFKGSSKTEDRRELLIFLTPKIVEQYAGS